MNKKKSKFSIAKLLISLFLIVIYLLPLYLLINMSFRTVQTMDSKLMFPSVLNLGNYIVALQNSALWVGLKNSVILAVLTVGIEIFVSAMGAYGIARTNNKFTEGIRQGSMAVMMIPPVALLVGTYSLMVSFHMTNTLWGLALLLAAGGVPASMFLYINFIVTIPTALDEAAEIDGASTFRTFISIILPQLKTVTITRVIIATIGCWNAYLMPMYLLQDNSKQTIILVIKSAFNSFNGIANVPLACATCVIGILPIIILYLFSQKYIIEGQLDGAVK